MTNRNIFVIAYKIIAFLGLLLSSLTAFSQSKNEVLAVSLAKVPSEIFQSVDYILIGDTDHTDMSPRLRLAKFLSVAKATAPNFNCLFLEEPADHNPSIKEYLESKDPSMDIIYSSQRAFDRKLDALKGYPPDDSPPGARSSLKPSVLEAARLNQFKVYGIDIDLDSSDASDFLKAFKEFQSEDSEAIRKGFLYILEGRTWIFAQKIKKYKTEGQCHKSIVFVGKGHLETKNDFLGDAVRIVPLRNFLDGGKANSISIELVD